MERRATPLQGANQDVARLDAKADKIKAYFDSCGEKPQRWFNGGSLAPKALWSAPPMIRIPSTWRTTPKLR